MPLCFQEELSKPFPSKTGCETFDSMYHLYDIFGDSSYFLVNLFFGPKEELSLPDILSFLKAESEKYNVSNWVVRCKQTLESNPLGAVAFSDVLEPNNMRKCAEYIYQRLKQNYDCVVHEVVPGPYPSNRLDWLYSFGLFYKNSLPQIEIYPATDASSIKWGKLSPLDLLIIDPTLNIKHVSIRDPQTLEIYRQAKLAEWESLFATEINEAYPMKKEFCNVNSLQKLLKTKKHPLFDLDKIDDAIQKTKEDLTRIALKWSLYAQNNHINPDTTIVHGSLLFNYRMIIWDISTDQRWQHLRNQ